MNTISDIENAVAELTKPRDLQSDRLIRNLITIGKALPALIAVAKAAQDVSTRWESPTWKNIESTAETMAILRARLVALKEME